LVIGLYSS